MNNLKDIEISIVVPVYEEDSNIRPFLDRIEPVLNKLNVKYEIIFSMDPGDDLTEKVITSNIQRNPKISLIMMNRRWGQNACLLAGIENCKGNTCVMIDVDLQDPPELIEKMYKMYKNGFDVVLTKRKSRKGEYKIRLLITYVGYWVINKISDVSIPIGVGDYRLVSRSVINSLINLKEDHGFLRGIIPFLGYKQTIISFDRDERKIGKTKYNRFYGSIKHGWDGVVAFSLKPLSYIISIGIIAVGISGLIAFYYLIKGILLDEEMIYGMLPVLLMVIFLGGVQLVCFGVLGQYIGRIYEQVRDRPKYIIRKKVNVL